MRESRSSAFWLINSAGNAVRSIPKRQFSVKVGTIFEDSPIGLDKWLPTVWLLVNCKNGISSYEVARDLGVTQKTAWFMLQRVRLAMQTGTFEKVQGQVEADETFIGGLARFMHKADRASKIKGTGGAGKAIVMGILDRNTGKVHVKHVPNTQRQTLQSEIREHVEAGSEVFTDEWIAYNGLDREYVHQVINHAESLRQGQRPYEPDRELLVLSQARPQRHLYQRRAIPSVPISRRAGVPVQRAQSD